MHVMLPWGESGDEGDVGHGDECSIWIPGTQGFVVIVELSAKQQQI